MNDVSQSPLPSLPRRAADSHKGDYGRVLIVGGSRGMAGAPALAGMAALRSGAGLVSIAAPMGIQPTVAAFSPCFMTIPLQEDEYGIVDIDNLRSLSPVRERFDAWALGPGLGQSEGAAELVGGLYRDVPRPMVVDADGLNALANLLRRHGKLLDRPAGPRVLTPHAGEFARLSDEAPGGDPHERAELAGELARRDSSGATVVVLKGHRTVVTDGSDVAINSTGNPGMATGGTGDCLTGIIVALLGQGLQALPAARLGAHLHGAAGDAASEQFGETSLQATDLINHLPVAFQAASRSQS